MATRIIDFNQDWYFSKLENNNSQKLPVTEAAFDHSGWAKISTPHTYNDIDGASGRTGICEGGEHYYRGLCCYRKRFDADFENKQIFAEFEGVNTVAEVFVNGISAGVHKGGYSRFRFDITKLLKPDDNVISVLVSNAPTDYIAPITDQGDFTKMGGIYRGVSLIVKEKAHIDMLDFGSSGVYVTLNNITADNADVDILVKVANYDNKKPLSIKAELCDLADNVVATAFGELLAEKRCEISLKTNIRNPILWNGIENPYLYTAKISLFDGDTLLDYTEQCFGIRTYHIDLQKGFFLNGKYIDLHGVNYHQDSFENGWAMTDAQRERDYNMMLDMGVNAVRMAHYQHCQHEYDLCDRLGIAVWAEVGIVNRMSPDNDTLRIDERFYENAKTQLIELIRQNYNHPSIIVWGISNELHQMSDEIYKIYQDLHAVAQKEDKFRLKTFADAQFWGKFLELPADVVGYNRYFGWYKDAGHAKNFGEWLDLYHNEKESRPVCVSEYGGGGAISQHKENIDWENEIDPWGERHYENYQSLMHEQIWAQFAKRPYLWGKFVWCMFDFASCGREEGDTKGQNDKGLATRERIPKDAYYYYKSVWNKEKMLHITNKRFARRIESITEVKAYSNAQSAELFVNGISLGRAKQNEDNPTIFVWENVTLQTGENNFEVVAYFADGSTIKDNAKATL